jgi:hypothetical protein
LTWQIHCERCAINDKATSASWLRWLIPAHIQAEPVCGDQIAPPDVIHQVVCAEALGQIDVFFYGRMVKK